ncbi:hypothetical protein BDA96_05G154400 [Sorghum bicolor]|uniref:Uncharacterized protein n=2 Tax=Sorghum bicolor TaxID=4558 RepID=A0A921QY54_SORBI|nr:hypothetical protein BDA96_05G154400 [Sorghum bicolor]KXG28579.1 hypothetical protein SORBI_3005G140400 [Sorghum bicolor]
MFMASSIKICTTRIVYLAAALILVLGTMPTFPSCQAGGCCPGGIKEQCYFAKPPCRTDMCASYCYLKGHEKSHRCVKINNGNEECCCEL